jgi:hypothetical protein
VSVGLCLFQLDVRSSISVVFSLSSSDRIDYFAFCSKYYQRDYSCIFEFVSPQKKLVVNYEKNELVLIAIRHHGTGEYVTYKEMKEAADKVPLSLFAFCLILSVTFSFSLAFL